jgi:hypothetical protein
MVLVPTGSSISIAWSTVATPIFGSYRRGRSGYRDGSHRGRCIIRLKNSLTLSGTSTSTSSDDRTRLLGLAGVRVEWDPPGRRTSDVTRCAVYRWDREAAAAGERRQVFCMSPRDFWDNRVPDEWRTDALNTRNSTRSRIAENDP